MAIYFLEESKKGRRLAAKRESTGRIVALTGYVKLTEHQIKEVNELVRMANLGRRVPLSRAYAMFPRVK